MLLSKIVKIKWNSKIKKHYVNKGYVFTKMKDEFEVNVNDLTHGSGILVEVQCDYCGKHYTKRWDRYLLENKECTVHKDCCYDCKKHKIEETSLKKYGVNTVLKLKEVKEKVAHTNLKKYGAENPFASEEIKQKIYATNIEKYGTPIPTLNPEVIEKTKKTCMEKYGVPFYIMKERHIGEDNPRWKGGVAYHRVERSCYEYYSWRKEVFNRDYYTCQCCGDRNGNGHTVELHSHHIKN